MSWVLMLALQTAPPPPPPPPVDFDLARIRPIDFDLRTGRGNDDCGARGTAEILVCGRRRRDGDYQYEAWARQFEPARIVAETRLFGDVTGDVYGESATLDRGAISHRVMLRIRVPF